MKKLSLTVVAALLSLGLAPNAEAMPVYHGGVLATQSVDEPLAAPWRTDIPPMQAQPVTDMAGLLSTVAVIRIADGQNGQTYLGTGSVSWAPCDTAGGEVSISYTHRQKMSSVALSQNGVWAKCNTLIAKIWDGTLGVVKSTTTWYGGAEVWRNLPALPTGMSYRIYVRCSGVC